MRLLLTGLKYFLFIGLCLSPMTFISCSDDENGGGIELGNYLNGTYAPGNEKNLLSATIDGETVSGDAFRGCFRNIPYRRLQDRKHDAGQCIRRISIHRNRQPPVNRSDRRRLYPPDIFGEENRRRYIRFQLFRLHCLWKPVYRNNDDTLIL